MNDPNEKYRRKLLTIPNLLSLLRLCMIPVIVWLYVGRESNLWATAVLALSGLTDIADGIIARKFHMVSDFGKAFDPVADKLTQMAMLLCLMTRFPLMLLPLAVLVCKELFDGITGLLVVHRTGQVLSARWHGKAATASLYALMLLHLLWPRIPAAASHLLIAACTALELLSWALYGIQNLGLLNREASHE